MSLSNDPSDWTKLEVKEWLISQGLCDYCELLIEKHKIDGKILLGLELNDITSPLLDINVYGDAKRLYIAIKQLIKRKRQLSSLSLVSDSTSDEELQTLVDSGNDIFSSGFEFRRCFLSFVYLFISCYFTAISMVIVHNRVPDMDKYPPLPDAVLDNLPYIPWAFTASEILILLNFAIWLCVLAVHQYRFTILKRYCSIFGTVFLLRCFTMLSTSLSVPGKHNQWWRATLWRSFEIMGYAGLSLNGVTSCGDYMFSGHTVVHTLMTLFITECIYKFIIKDTPKKYSILHLISRIMAVFGMFFILAAHEHYTLDVICAFYVSLRIFSNYHVLATAQRVDRNMAKSWNPIFYFMEKPIETARFPNIYENPLTAISRWFRLIKYKSY